LKYINKEQCHFFLKKKRKRRVERDDSANLKTLEGDHNLKDYPKTPEGVVDHPINYHYLFILMTTTNEEVILQRNSSTREQVSQMLIWRVRTK
jgi:hypothetical protein